MPQPNTSNQPVWLQTRQPSPPHITHSISASAEGSVKGKYEGRKRTDKSSCSKNFCKKSIKIALRSVKETFSSTIKPST